MSNVKLSTSQAAFREHVGASWIPRFQKFGEAHVKTMGLCCKMGKKRVVIAAHTSQEYQALLAKCTNFVNPKYLPPRFSHQTESSTSGYLGLYY
jgi:hypothetical protein